MTFAKSTGDLHMVFGRLFEPLGVVPWVVSWEFGVKPQFWTYLVKITSSRARNDRTVDYSRCRQASAVCSPGCLLVDSPSWVPVADARLPLV